MNKSRLIISVAGSGKTEFLVNRALECKDKILITTYTNSNLSEIRNRILRKKGYIPENIILLTWESFVFKQLFKPYQFDLSNLKIERVNWTENNKPDRWKINRSNTKKYYLQFGNINGNKMSEFVCCKAENNNVAFQRVSGIFKKIYIDETQDLSSWDLVILENLIKVNVELEMVGDSKQCTYRTLNANKYSQYNDGKIINFFQDKLGNSVEIDLTTLNKSHRMGKSLKKFVNSIETYFSNNLLITDMENEYNTNHDGLFFVKSEHVKNYLKKYNAVQLKYDINTKVEDRFESFNFGQAKGMTFDRILIYPTKGMIDWFENGKNLEFRTLCKFYVAATRAKYSVGIVWKNKELPSRFNDWKFYDKI